jgi:tRNA-uridine 2-sulfurtransferase
LPGRDSDKRESTNQWCLHGAGTPRTDEISCDLTTARPTLWVEAVKRVPAREKILVAMSGGVDSSVAALLLKQQGCDIVGAYMKNWINEDNIVGDCPWQRDIEDARAVADQIGIEFRVVNLMHDYRTRVVEYLLDGYARGLTPNPDVMCNREIKFGVFRSWAKDNGFDAVATGHYAQRREAGALQFGLFEGADKNKDQSYFLALLSQEQLRDARFPIGHLGKPELRTLARDANLPTANKKDSQGICFIGEVKMSDFLRAYVPDAPGPIVRATDERELGTHRGLHFYTLGQRKGIGVPSNTDHEAYVVVGKRAHDRALLVAFDHPDAPGLFQQTVRVHSLSWTGEPLTSRTRLEGRVRYRDPRVALEFSPETDGPGTALVMFDVPQRGLASGQIIAFYEGEQLLGGGVYV